MKYRNPSFSVSLGGKDYRVGYDAIDWSKVEESPRETPAIPCPGCKQPHEVSEPCPTCSEE